MPMTRRRTGGLFSGDGLGLSARRCDLPMTAFLLMASRRPISAVGKPWSHNTISWSMSSVVQMLSMAVYRILWSGHA